MADGNSCLFNLPYPRRAIICGCPSQVPRPVPLTELVSSLIPAAVKECRFPPASMIGPDSQSEPVTVKRQSSSFFFLLSSLGLAHHSPLLPNFNTWLDTATSLMSYCSHWTSLFYLPCQFLTPLLFKYVFLHSHLKASDFNKTIKKENRFCFGFHSVCSGCATFLDRRHQLKRDGQISQLYLSWQTCCCCCFCLSFLTNRQCLFPVTMTTIFFGHPLALQQAVNTTLTYYHLIKLIRWVSHPNCHLLEFITLTTCTALVQYLLLVLPWSPKSFKENIWFLSCFLLINFLLTFCLLVKKKKKLEWKWGILAATRLKIVGC